MLFTSSASGLVPMLQLTTGPQRTHDPDRREGVDAQEERSLSHEVIERSTGAIPVFMRGGSLSGEPAQFHRNAGSVKIGSVALGNRNIQMETSCSFGT